ncbi:hypothetical protein CAC42_8005 [Sphaceloma murrayae]|uniref:Uncharacterized protein n=1 Tax=Sphaceloma murrayae TaxID=2082308 RepID=A0A2K1QM07_9PEZI|nr:hypothetical protein CAC42_8005 [Sphaceloma murrayae]
MSLSNGQAGNAPVAGKHARQNTRIIPVIPRQYSRKSLDKAVEKKTSQTTPSQSSPASRTTLDPLSSGAAVDEVDDGTGRKTATPVEGGDDRDTHTPVANQTSPHEDAHASTGAENPGTSDAEVISDGATKAGTNGLKANGYDYAEGSYSEQSQSAMDRESVASQVPSASIGLPHASPNTSTSDSQPGVQLPASHVDRGVNRQSFVFGGHVDSSAPSPAPPHSAGSWTSSLHPDGTVSPPPSSLNGLPKPPRAVNGHSASPQNPQDSFAGSRPSQSQPVWQHPHPSATPNGHGTPVQRQLHRDGLLQTPRSGSIGSNPSDVAFPQAPNYVAPPPHPLYLMNANDSATSLPRNPPFSPFTPSFTPSRGHIPFEPRYQPDYDMQSAVALRSHVESFLGSLDFVDTVLQMPQSSNGPSQVTGHALILSRSPKLRRTMLSTPRPRSTTYRDQQCQVLDVSGDALFREGGLFSLALRSLYGASLIRREHLPGHLKSPKQVMEWVLSYATAGWYLEVPEVVMAGLGLATELLIIDNVEVALGFALAQHSDAHADTDVTQTGISAAPDAIRPKYAPYAFDFLFAILRFITWPLINNFEFDSSAPQLETLRRIPDHLIAPAGPFKHSSRPSVSNPKLQGIQLGDFQLHSSVNRTLSSILLSVPTFVLQSLFGERMVLERLSPEARATLLRTIVQERERRRMSACMVFENMSDEQQRHFDRLTSTLYTSEQVELARDSGIVSLTQTRAAERSVE